MAEDVGPIPTCLAPSCNNTCLLKKTQSSKGKYRDWCSEKCRLRALEPSRTRPTRSRPNRPNQRRDRSAYQAKRRVEKKEAETKERIAHMNEVAPPPDDFPFVRGMSEGRGVGLFGKESVKVPKESVVACTPVGVTVRCLQCPGHKRSRERIVFGFTVKLEGAKVVKISGKHLFVGKVSFLTPEEISSLIKKCTVNTLVCSSKNCGEKIIVSPSTGSFIAQPAPDKDFVSMVNDLCFEKKIRRHLESIWQTPAEHRTHPGLQRGRKHCSASAAHH